MKLFQKASAAVLAVCGVLSAVPGAQAAGLQDLPGQELWQPYLNAAPQDADSFVHDPVGALLSLLPTSPLEMIRQMVHCYADVLLFPVRERKEDSDFSNSILAVTAAWIEVDPAPDRPPPAMSPERGGYDPPVAGCHNPGG